MSTTNPPDDVILNSEGMHLQMSAVDPTPQEFFLFKDKIVPEKVYEYYKGNSVNTFIYNKAYHVGKKDKANEFASMWIERTSFITRDGSCFPNTSLSNFKKQVSIFSWNGLRSTVTL